MVGRAALTGVTWTRWDPGTGPWRGAGERVGFGAWKGAESEFPANTGTREQERWERGGLSPERGSLSLRFGR